LPSFAEQEGPKEAAFQLMFSDKPVKEGWRKVSDGFWSTLRS
jgi:hypothetical protein